MEYQISLENPLIDVLLKSSLSMRYNLVSYKGKNLLPVSLLLLTIFAKIKS
jgi:hypothetical protein